MPTLKSSLMTVRFEPPLLREIERAAKAEDRPVSSLVRKIVADWLRARKEPK